MNWGCGMVKWSACSPFTPMIRVQIPLKSTVLFCKLFEKNENKTKRCRGWPVLENKRSFLSVTILLSSTIERSILRNINTFTLNGGGGGLQGITVHIIPKGKQR